MSLGNTALRLIRRKGEPAVLRRVSTLRRPSDGAAVVSLLLAEAAAEGATELTFTATGLAGGLVAGSVITLAGQDLALAADAAVEGGELLVTLTAALEASAAQGAPATLGALTVEQDCYAFERLAEGQVEEGQVEQRVSRVMVAGVSLSTPRAGDQLVYLGAARPIAARPLGTRIQGRETFFEVEVAGP